LRAFQIPCQTACFQVPWMLSKYLLLSQLIVWKAINGPRKMRQTHTCQNGPEYDSLSDSHLCTQLLPLRNCTR
jgi:hypothetical protein